MYLSSDFQQYSGGHRSSFGEMGLLLFFELPGEGGGGDDSDESDDRETKADGDG